MKPFSGCNSGNHLSLIDVSGIRPCQHVSNLLHPPTRGFIQDNIRPWPEQNPLSPQSALGNSRWPKDPSSRFGRS